ncbi:hypothetical protein Goklo_024298, partial [Gossypium klotzschianum]|nr:hypothetical protein [Gossypium klotzschianum]
MENGFLDKVEDNAAVRVWSEKTQSEKGDSLAKGYTSELWDYTRISVTQNNLQNLKVIWDHWNDETKQLFNASYGDLPYLLDIKVDVHLFRAIAQFWSPAYDCFTFGGADLVPTIEEYIALLHCPKIQVDKIYSRAVNVSTFIKKLMNITGMIFSENYSPLKEIAATPVRDDISEEKWLLILQNLCEEDVEWRAPWLLPAVGYVPLMVLRQYKSRQFIPATQGLAKFEFSYKDNGYKKKIREI